MADEPRQRRQSEALRLLAAVQAEQAAQRRLLERILERLGAAAAAPQVVRSSEGTFVPGTGWAKPIADEAHDSAPVGAEAVQRVQAAREALRQPPPPDSRISD
jgi:hypothetical protein